MLQLDILGHAGEKALDIDLTGVPALWLQEELVALLVGKAHHLLLKAGTVARPQGIDCPGRYGRAVQVVAHDLQRLLGGIHRIAGQLGPPVGHLLHRIGRVGRRSEESVGDGQSARRRPEK